MGSPVNDRAGGHPVDESMIVDNVKLAWNAAAKCYYRWSTDADFDDMRAGAVLGLVKASQTYDPSKGTWASWAWLHARDEAQRAVRNMTYWFDGVHDIESVPVTEQLRIPRESVTAFIEDDERSAMVARMLDIIEGLPDKQRVCVTRLNGLNGCEPTTERELAKELGYKSKNSVHHHHKRALEAIREGMEG